MFLKQCKTDYLWYMIEKEQADEALLNEIHQSASYKNFSKKQNSIFTALGNGIVGTSIFIDFLWAILYIANLSLITISILSVVGVLSLALGGGIAWASYIKANKKQKKLNKDMEVALCKEAIYNELLQRQEVKLEKKGLYIWNQIVEFAKNNSRLENLNAVRVKFSLGENFLDKNQLLKLANNKQLQAEILEALTDEHYPVKLQKPIIKKPLINDIEPINYKSKIIKAAITGIGLTSILFGSFYVSTIFMLTGTAAAALLTNPIGIAVSLGCLSIIGLLYAYKVYQESKQFSLKHKEIKTKTSEVQHIIYRYEAVKSSSNSLQKLSEKISCHRSNKYFYSGLFLKPGNKNSTQQELINKNEVYKVESNHDFNVIL